MPGVYMRFSRGRPGASAANVHYITREPATDADREAVLVRNYPDYVTERGDYRDLRADLEEYARQCEEDELHRPRNGGSGEVRTHYRAVLSFEDRTDTQQARDMADEYLDRTFPDAPAVAAVHQDTDHTHVHIHIQARDVNDEKLHFDRDTYRSLDHEWADIYGREFGRHKAEDHEEKKQMTRDWKTDYYQDRDEDRDPKGAPERADHPTTPDEAHNREGDLYGRDEAGDRADERTAPDGGPETDRDERALADSARELDRADETSDATVRTAEDLADRLDERSPDRVLERDEYDRDHDRGR